jgi:hypothetical protein
MIGWRRTTFSARSATRERKPERGTLRTVLKISTSIVEETYHQAIPDKSKRKWPLIRLGTEFLRRTGERKGHSNCLRARHHLQLQHNVHWKHPAS